MQQVLAAWAQGFAESGLLLITFDYVCSRKDIGVRCKVSFMKGGCAWKVCVAVKVRAPGLPGSKPEVRFIGMNIMIRKTLIVALACAGMALGSVAQAKGDHGRGHGPRHGHGHYQKHGGGHGAHAPGRAYHKGYRDGYRDAPRVVHRGWAPAPPPRRHWARGDRLPHFHRGGYYVVHDWHAHHLHRPSRGYQWVRVGSDYLLVAIASGIITSIILNQ